MNLIILDTYFLTTYCRCRDIPELQRLSNYTVSIIFKMMSFGYRPTSNVFERQYHVNSTGFAGKDITDGDKIFLPPSAFEQLARMVVEYPMLFEARNVRTGRKTHCGVLEFSSEEGFCYMPFWMMQNLGVCCFVVLNSFMFR